MLTKYLPVANVYVVASVVALGAMFAERHGRHASALRGLKSSSYGARMK